MTNSQVPFIQVTGVKKTTEQLAQIASNYPNAIIFYKYTDSVTGITESSIWAHGEEYKTGGSDAHYKISTVNASTNPGPKVSSANVTTGAIGGWTPSVGDFFIEKEILDDEGLSTEKAQYTAYVWSYVAGGSSLAWRALDGNYNAENVYFTKDITLAGNYTRVGNITKNSTSATSTLNASGISLKELIETIFTKEEYPTTSKTSTATLTSLVTAPTPVLKKSTHSYTDGELVAIGTTGISLDGLTANTSSYSGTETTTVSGFTYGYATASDGSGASNDSSKSETRTTPTEKSGTTYSLSVSISGFTNSTAPTYSSNETASNVTSSLATSLNAVEAGANSVSVTETGRPHVASVSAIPALFIKSNVGKYSNDHKSNAVDAVNLESNAPTDTKSITIYGVYPILTNGKQASGSDTNTSSNADFRASGGATIGALGLSNTYVVDTSTGTISKAVFYLGFGPQATHSWDIYLPSTITSITAKGYNPASSDKWSINYTFTQESSTSDVSSIQSAGTYYKWTCSGSGGANIVKITLS